MSKKYKIEHDRENCIGCGVCCAICPSRWKMVDDGKSQWQGDWEVAEDEYAINKEAADSCPVNVIHIINQETGERIV